jgi:hypothetical protein
MPRCGESLAEGESMQRTVAILMFALAVGSACALASDTASEISPKCHPWGSFLPGAWKTVRVIVENYDEGGLVVSTCVNDTRTTLVNVDDDGVTLEVHACVEVAGKRFDPEPQTLRQAFNGELLGPSIVQGAPHDGEVTIDGKKIPCRIQQLDWTTSNSKTVVTLYYSTTVAPYILKRECVTKDPEGKNLLSETTVEAVALSVPLTVRGEQRNGIRMKTVQRSAKGVVETLADVLPDVPGGVVGNRSKETDPAGRVVRRSTLQLVDYGTEAERFGPFGRKRPPRHRPKPSSPYDP